MNVTWIGSPNHFNGRDGCRVTHITLHVMAGYLAGTDTVFSRSATQTSATYGIGGGGEIHQYVDEKNGPWSDANYSSNMTGISIEHQGGLDFIPCTDACLDASAALCADISRRYGLGRLWHDGTCGNVWLHREIPGSTHAICPDLAPNGVNVDYIINKANQLLANGGTIDMAITDADIMKIWTHQLPNGRAARDIISDATSDIVRMHDNGMTGGQWMHKLPNGRYARDVISDATSDVIRLHDTMIPQLTAQVSALSTAVETLAKSMGESPQDIGGIVDKAVRDKLAGIKLTVQEGA